MAHKSQPLLDFYKLLLNSLSLEVGDDGLISEKDLDGELEPAMVGDQRLVLPTDEILTAGIGPEMIAFHPLSESIARRGTSPVMDYIKEQAKTILTSRFSIMALTMIRVAADPELQREAPSSALDFLSKVKDADDKAKLVVTKVIDAALRKPNGIATVYLKNGGTYKGKKVGRLCTIRFPILEAVEDDSTNKVYGVTLTRKVKDRVILQELFRHIVPLGDDPEEYSAGSHSQTAPYFYAFLQAWAKILKQYNKMVKRYSKHLGMDLEVLEDGFVSQIDDLDEWLRLIPPMRGNEGGVKEAEVAKETTRVEAPATAPTNMPSQQPAAAPPVNREPTLADRIRYGNQPQPQPMAPVQPSYTPPWERSATGQSNQPPWDTSTPSGMTYGLPRRPGSGLL